MTNFEFSEIVEGISSVIGTEEVILCGLPTETITLKRNKQNRTIKQILGHLIDSASNNHQRMIRLQYCEYLLFFPDYRQDNDRWIALQDYQNADWDNLIQLWKFYNLHIIQVIRSVDQTKLDNYWCDFEGIKVTLREMIKGYLDHLHLHINEIHDLMQA
ncbi:DinB family protein [Parabacteroides timonensis]|uniref:DinB family protein n=1 Tax=Parabacteroides timonensis TaxID=1871013 RepID=UPI00094EFCC6|nr:DinB family protein [Parabacteroides timonensis]